MNYKDMERVTMSSRVNIGAAAVVARWMSANGIHVHRNNQSAFINECIEVLAHSLVENGMAAPVAGEEEALEVLFEAGVYFGKGSKGRKDIENRVKPTIRRKKQEREADNDWEAAARELMENMDKTQKVDRDRIKEEAVDTGAEGKHDGIAGIPGEGGE